jgi:DNA repair exonuclease SbcCD ATPase subunit
MDEQQNDILDFGMSVSVNDDSRRKIEQKTEELIQRIQKSEKELMEEKNKHQKLSMKKETAENETKQLYDRSKDLCDTMSTVTDIFRGEYVNKFKHELAMPTLVTPHPTNNQNDGTEVYATTRGTEHDDPNKNNTDENLNRSKADNDMVVILKEQKEFQEKFRHLPARIKTLQDALRATVARSKDKTVHHQKAMEKVNRLKSEVDDLNTETESLKETWQTYNDKHKKHTERVSQLESSIRELQKGINEKVRDMEEWTEKKNISFPKYFLSHSFFFLSFISSSFYTVET